MCIKSAYTTVLITLPLSVFVCSVQCAAYTILYTAVARRVRAAEMPVVVLHDMKYTSCAYGSHGSAINHNLHHVND